MTDSNLTSSLPEHDSAAALLVSAVRENCAAQPDAREWRERWIRDSEDFVEHGVRRGFKASLVETVSTATRYVRADARAA